MPTALDYLHVLAEETGEHGSFTTTSAGSTTTLVCSTLVNSALAASEFAGMYVLIEDGACAGQVGHAKTLVRSTGTLSVSDAFTATIQSGVTFSLYHILPPLDGEGVLPSYLKLVNWALRRIPIERTIAFSGVTDQGYYPVPQSTYPWFTDEERILWIEYPVTDADELPRRLRPEAWEWDTNGQTRRLWFRGAPFKTGETFGVKVMAPGNSLLKRDGTWTEQASQTAGLSLFTNGVADEALPDVADVVTMATALMYRALSRLEQPSAEVAEWLAQAQPAFRAARALQHTGLPEDRTANVVTFRPVVVRHGGRR